jgi:small-conductance mechanosensitive channel
VGVAYGSDTELVEQTLLRVASENRLVVREPKPMVVFSKFGDSTLNFELRVHVPNREVYSQVQHQLHMQIDKAFRAANIEIAFPQQEIHFDDRSKKLVQQVLDTIDQFRGGASLKSEDQSPSAAGTDLTVAAQFAAIEGAIKDGCEEASFKKAG